jgi:calcineurin-like phosphoesterase family protein
MTIPSWKIQNNHKYFESIDQIKKIRLEDKEIILCHYPMAEWEKLHPRVLSYLRDTSMPLRMLLISIWLP